MCPSAILCIIYAAARCELAHNYGKQWEKKCEREYFLYQLAISTTVPYVPHRSNGETDDCLHHLRFLRMIFTFLHQFSNIFSLFSGDGIEYKLQTMTAFAINVFINFFCAFFYNLCVCFFCSFMSFWVKKRYLHMNWRRIIQKHAIPCTSISNEANSYVNSRMSIWFRRNTKHLLTSHTHTYWMKCVVIALCTARHLDIGCSVLHFIC